MNPDFQGRTELKIIHLKLNYLNILSNSNQKCCYKVRLKLSFPIYTRKQKIL